MNYKSKLENQDEDTVREYRHLTRIIIFSCLVFFIILSTRTFFYRAKDNLGIFTNASIFKMSVNCSEFNDKFEECVQAEAEGKGCSWYSHCRICVKRKNYSEDDFKEMCEKK